jgi:branched-chain amino acid transport system ATP-binding protein
VSAGESAVLVAQRTGAPAAIAVDRLVAGYGRGEVLHGVEITAARGERVALLGANGAGKTTLLRAIMGMIRPFSGEVRLDGEEITGEPLRTRAARGVALVPEGRRVFPGLSVKANLLMGAYCVKDKAQVTSTYESLLETFPILAEKLNERGGALSGGQQQTLAIARAMMCNPSVLLMDEPSLGLSPQMRTQVFEVIKRISASGEVTVIVVEQDVERALGACDRFYALKSGRIGLSGDCATASRTDLRDVYL